jgi:hypothetical protein
MGILTDEERQYVEGSFALTDFRSMFDIINNVYESLKFRDNITDSERISEYKYITQQLRKYISGRYDTIAACGSDLNMMLSTVERWLSDAPEYGDDRKNLVYNFLRDQWLIETYNNIKWLMDKRAEESEDE